MKKVITVIIIIALMICLGIFIAPYVSNKCGKIISDIFVPNDTKSEFDTSKSDSAPSGKNYLNEQILYETILIEDLIKEEILTEEILEEKIIAEIKDFERIQSEEIKIEEVNVEIYDDINDMEDDFCCESYYSIDLDYSFIKQRIAAGASIVISEIIIDTASLIIDIVTCQWGEAIIDAGQICLTVGGTTVSAFVASQVAKAKSLAAGNSYEIAMYDALYEGANAYYYSAVKIDKINTAISIAQLVDAGAKTAKSVVDFIKSKKAVDIIDSTGKVVGKASSNGTYKITVDGAEKTCKAAKSTNLSGSIDLYDTKTKSYVSTLTKKGNVLSQTPRSIPSEILLSSGDNAGKAKYIFEGTDAYKVTYTINGDATKTWIGTVDQGGFIKNNFGQIVKKIDFDTGKEINGFSKMIKSSKGNKITADVFGDLVEVTNVSKQTTKPLTKKSLDGVVTYLDSANNKIFTEYVGADGITYLKRASDNINYAKVSGSLSDGSYNFNWKVNLDSIRCNATSTIRSNLVKYVKNNNINLVRQNFPELSLEMIDYIKKYDRIPTSIQIHHCKNVANFPDLAGDYRNLVVLTRDTHLAEHFGDFHNATTSNPSAYKDLKVLFGL